MKITIAGAGYVGLSNAILLAQYNQVTLLDIDPYKIELINNKKSPISDKDIEAYLSNKELNLLATTDISEALIGAEFVIIATPTDYNTTTKKFNTSSVEQIIQKTLSINPRATIIIKSTIPVGFTLNMRNKFNTKNIIFSPEFLREGKALYDNLYPSRIIVGSKSPNANIFAQLLAKSALKKDINILFMNSTEAEAVKLFSNSYLAMRIAFFNELDTYAYSYNLNTKDIIKGVSADPRIGQYYNNPSFGYGGYCLPKDTKQLLANYSNIPQNLIGAIVTSNSTRKNFIANDILNKNPKTVGIYRLIMKSDSDNFRASAIQDIISQLTKENKNINIVIYEPSFKKDRFNGYPIISEFSKFLELSDIILANRLDSYIAKYREKVYTRDIFGCDI